MNEMMRRHRYHEDKFWQGIFGVSVDELWRQYKETWGKPKQDVAGTVEKSSSITGADSDFVQIQEKEKPMAVQGEKKSKEFVI
jgi:hypothetical protein